MWYHFYKYTVRKNNQQEPPLLGPAIPKEMNAPASIAEDRADEDSLIRTEMVNDITLEYVRHGLDRALRLVGVVVPRTRNRIAWRNNVDLPMWVLEAQETSWNEGNQVRLIVDTDEVRHLCEPQ